MISENSSPVWPGQVSNVKLLSASFFKLVAHALQLVADLPWAAVFGQPVGMFHRPFHFVRDEPALKDTLFPSNSSAVHAASVSKR